MSLLDCLCGDLQLIVYRYLTRVNYKAVRLEYMSWMKKYNIHWDDNWEFMMCSKGVFTGHRFSRDGFGQIMPWGNGRIFKFKDRLKMSRYDQITLKPVVYLPSSYYK